MNFFNKQKKSEAEAKGSPNILWSKLIILMGIIGPGIMAANINTDAGGVATFSLVGSNTGLRLLWLLLPIAAALVMIQEMSARMGVVSGKGLADLIREKFGLKITFYSFFFLIITDLGNIMAEFAGLATATEMFGISRFISVPIFGVLVWLIISKGNIKIVERAFLIGCLIFVSYIISGFFLSPDWLEIGKKVVAPNLSGISKSDFPMIVGLIGTTITPWMQFYLQTAVVEKDISIKYLWQSKVDVLIGCFTMLVISFFIIVCCALTMGIHGDHLKSLGDAGTALKPFVNQYSDLLFAFGLVNASFFAAALLPLATSSYVCEGMGWDAGTDRTFKEAPNFYTIFTFLIVMGAILVLIPSTTLFNILIYSQILNGLLIPFVMLVIINLCNDPDIMGEYTNGPIYNFFCYSFVVGMLISNICFIIFEIF